MKLCLGTAQFGMNYGVTNSSGQTSRSEVAEILEFSRKNRITHLDTAPSYGESEKVLGENNLDGFNIVSKLSYIKNEVISKEDIEEVITKFTESLNTLKVPSIEALLIHNVNDMYKEGSDELYKQIFELKEKGLVKKIGVSIYEKDQIDTLYNRFHFDSIQIPINVLDQRLLQSDVLKNLKNKDVEIHARSIFLQGLLLNELSSQRESFQQANMAINNYYSHLNSLGLSKLEGALTFINSIKEIDFALFGVNNVKQLNEIHHAYNSILQHEKKVDFSQFAINNEEIIDPRKW